MPTLERETELDCIAAALDAAADGRGRTVVIEGAAGIGKTRLVADARALAKVRGFGRMWAVGDELESAMPWAVVRQLVERSIARYGGEAREKLLAGPSGAALAALDRAPDEAHAGDAALARTLHALWWVAAHLASYRPVLITVDDAQWADTPSLRFLAHLAPPIGDLSIALIVATRPPADRSGPLAELAAARFGARLAPQPLSFAAIGELVTREDITPAPAVLDALHAASGGNPFLAMQLIEELGDRPRKLMFSGAESLTASERRIADLAAQGRSNRDIAQELLVTPKTVENHVGRVYMKLGIKGRRELATALAA